MADEERGENPIVEIPNVPKAWAKEARKAAAELAKNNRVLESAASTGLANGQTLSERRNLSGSQAGEDILPQKVYKFKPNKRK